jgi:diaminohydroxyphosphoribosylaminopyrimidine deaminase / 5-amino-6-(5-phosphoribosylamino)uracil reductase
MDSRADAAFMSRALALAERGRGRTSPNPMVGAVVVDDDGVVVGRGSHERAGGPHAEVHALTDAGDRARGATLYCTLEPCTHTGRTGPCAPLVARSGIRRVVVAVQDPNPKVRGGGLAHLRAQGIEVCVGVLQADAERLNRPFFTSMRLGRPHVTMKAALSLDGRLSAARRTRTPITGVAASVVVQRERAEVDAIAIGSETAIVDDPLLTARVAYRHRPLVRVVFDRRLRVSASARLFSTLDAGPVVIFTAPLTTDDRRRAADALRKAGASIEEIKESEIDNRACLPSALRRLLELGVISIVVEGGAVLHGALWRESLVDRVQLFVSPRALGPSGVEWIDTPAGTLAALHDFTARPVGDDVLIEGHVHGID